MPPTKTPTQPSNRHVIDQAETWGWRIVGRKRGKVRMKHLITRETIDLQPTGNYPGNPTLTLIELYRKTSVTGEGFWQGPSRIAIDQIRTAETTPVDAPPPADKPEPEPEPELLVHPTYGSDPVVVTPKTPEGREAVIRASQLPGGPSIRNQVFAVLAKSGMPMGADEIYATLGHLDYRQIQQALSGMFRVGTIARVKSGIYQTKAAPVTDRTRVDVVSPDEHHVELVPHRSEPKKTRGPALARFPVAPPTTDAAASQPTPEPEPEPETAPEPVPMPAPTPTVGADGAMTAEDLDELFDVIFPNGVTVRARHLNVIDEWKRATMRMIQELTND